MTKIILIADIIIISLMTFIYGKGLKFTEKIMLVIGFSIIISVMEVGAILGWH